MKYRRTLFFSKNIYDIPSSDRVFHRAMRENIAFHTRKCPEYKTVLERLDFDIRSLISTEDLHKIPPLPTSYLKSRSLLSKPYKKLFVFIDNYKM